MATGVRLDFSLVVTCIISTLRQGKLLRAQTPQTSQPPQTLLSQHLHGQSLVCKAFPGKGVVYVQPSAIWEAVY